MPSTSVIGHMLDAAARRPFATTLAALASVSLFFLLVPQLDIAVSSLFYDPATGFLHERLPVINDIREAGQIAAWSFALAVIAPLAIKLVAPDLPLLVRPRITLFVLTSLALGPGLLVNGILKEFWGRARPRELLEFGGESSFSRVWWISDQCQDNCSFVAGEAAGAFWLVALAFIVPRALRSAAAIATVAFAAIVSFTRIAMGGHFLSDVLIAWLLVLLVILLMHRLVVGGLPPGFDGAVERALAFPAQALRRRFALRRPPPPL